MLAKKIFLSTIFTFFIFVLHSVPVRYSAKEQALLEAIQRESQQEKKNYQDFNLREEKIIHLGVSPNQEKILFYKKIRIKNKVLRELLLLDPADNILDRYILENVKNYRERKKALVEENNIVLTSFSPEPVRGNIASLSQRTINILINYHREKPQITFYLGEEREKYILGSRQLKNPFIQQMQVDKLYSFFNDTVIVFIINYSYLQDNLFYVYQQKLMPLVLNEKSLRQARKVTSENNFALNGSIVSTPFFQENYFDFQDKKISEINYFFTGEQKEELVGFSPIYAFFR